MTKPEWDTHNFRLVDIDGDMPAVPVDISSVSTGITLNTHVLNSINRIGGFVLGLNGLTQQFETHTCETVFLQATTGNANPVYIGGANVTGTGNAYHELTAGAFISFDIDNTNRVHVFGTAPDILRVMYVNIG